MARLARFVLPGIPHHVTQRGNGRQQVFFGADDYAACRDLLAVQCAAHGVAVWSWVLMPNQNSGEDSGDTGRIPGTLY